MDLGEVTAQLGAFKNADEKRALTEIFKALLSGGVSLGEPTHQALAGNLSAHYFASTSAASTGEFSIAHGLGSPPSLGILALDLRQAGAQLIPLEVSRAADSKRIYLKSTSTNAAFVLLAQ